MFFISDWYILPVAFLLDYLLGDPEFLPHPIRVMGKAIEMLEPWVREKIELTKFAGLVFAMSLIAGTWLVFSMMMAIAFSIHPFVGKMVEIIIVYYSISAFSLKKEARGVLESLTSEGLVMAKKRLSRIVGRDVEPLDETGVLRATLETVAENLVDGVISPLFWAGIGGAPMAMAYKMVNTLDSMVGYKNEKYLEFGMVAARIDDLANYLPARISVFLISVSAFFLKLDWKSVLMTAKNEGRNHSSPNSGYPEASFAGALKVCLGGPNIYGGVEVYKPFIGSEFGPVRSGDLATAIRLMVLSSGLAVFMGMTIAHVVSLL